MTKSKTNHCDKMLYDIRTIGSPQPAACDDMAGMAEQLLEQCLDAAQAQGAKPLRLIFFGPAENNPSYLQRLQLLRRKVDERCAPKGEQPVVSYVAQPLPGASMALELHAYRPDEDDRLTYARHEGHPYVLLENTDGRFLFAGGMQADVENTSIGTQADSVFADLQALMEHERFPVDSIVRQWNYIERIVDNDGPDQHYQLFNNARARFYQPARWDNGYPAATGIGATHGGVLVDVDAALFHRPGCYATPIDNKLQVAAHAYSPRVLKAAHEQKATPKFERAKSVTSDRKSIIYVSGTAAIRGEESLTGVGLERQLHITMENIALLTGKAKPRMLRVYLKEAVHYEDARRLMQQYVPGIPVLYTCTDVCRDELLIEIEGIYAC